MKLNPTDFSTKWKVTLFFATGEADLAVEFDDPLAVSTTTRTATPTDTTAANNRFTVTSVPRSALPPKTFNRLICPSQEAGLGALGMKAGRARSRPIAASRRPRVSLPARLLTMQGRAVSCAGSPPRHQTQGVRTTAVSEETRLYSTRC